MQDFNWPDFNWKKLQNGSDIRGVAIEGVADEPVNITPDVARRLGQAFATWLSHKLDKPAQALRIGVGRDSRRSGPELMQAVMEGMACLGSSVDDFAMASTPAMFMSTVTSGFECDGAIMMTASHLPFNRNGLKFFTAQGGLGKPDITEILALAEQGDFAVTEPGPIEAKDFISVYAEQLVQTVRTAVNHPDHFDQPLQGLKIIVDAGNGAGGFYASKVLEPLGADTTGSQFLDPDGMFPNHVPNPEDKDAMASICAAVLAHQADFGIIFDTDVDRSAAVDHEGKELNRNRLIALISAIVLQEHPGSTIVTDSITSDGLAQFIQELGGKHHRFKRGYKNVINEAVRLNNAGEESWLAIETSGHGAMRENYFLDDGAYLVSKLLIELARAKQAGRSLTDLIAPLKEPQDSQEYRLKLQAEDFKAQGQGVIEQLRGFVAAQSDWSIVPNNHEGIRVACESPEEEGWFLLRLSLHDPVLPLNIESNGAGGVERIRDRLHHFFSSVESLALPSSFAAGATPGAGGDESGDRSGSISGGLGIMLSTTILAISFVGFSLFVKTVQTMMGSGDRPVLEQPATTQTAPEIQPETTENSTASPTVSPTASPTPSPTASPTASSDNKAESAPLQPTQTDIEPADSQAIQPSDNEAAPVKPQSPQTKPAEAEAAPAPAPAPTSTPTDPLPSTKPEPRQ